MVGKGALSTISFFPSLHLIPGSQRSELSWSCLYESPLLQYISDGGAYTADYVTNLWPLIFDFFIAQT